MAEPKTLLKYPEPHSQVSFPVFKIHGEAPKGPIEKFLSLFADVRAGEGVTALLMALNAFVLLGGYYLLKTARESLILPGAGARNEALLSGAQAVLLMAVIPLYGWIGSRVNRLKLVAGADLFFAVNLVIFAAVGHGGSGLGNAYAAAFFIWVGIFNVFVISQFWAFANDIYTEGQGRRLFPMIAVGSAVGAVLGSERAAALSKAHHPPPELMLLCAIALLICIAIVFVVNRREILREDPVSAREAEEPLGRDGGFQLLKRDRYLFWIAVLAVLLNVVNFSGEYLFKQLVQNESIARFGAEVASKAARQDFTGALMGNYYKWYNAAALAIQLIVVSRLMRYAGVRAALFVLPCFALVGYSAAAIAPVLVMVRVLKVAENSVDYSLQKTVEQTLYLPTSREAKYKAKAAVDTFCKRFGDVIGSGVIYAVGAIGGQFGYVTGPGVITPAAILRSIAVISAVITLAWFWSATRIAKEHRKRTV